MLKKEEWNKNTMNALKRWLFRQLSKKAKPYLKHYGFLQTVKIFNKNSVVYEPQNEKVLVLAPHMDDEVIGCGGALHRHVLRGADVSVVFMTDGRAGSGSLVDLSGKERKLEEIELIKAREEESAMALKTLGIKEGVFLKGEDSNLQSNKDIRRELKQILYEFQPDLVYLPFFLEEHPDHRAVSWILSDVTEGTNFNFDCVGYEVWTPLFPNCYVNISNSIEVKKKALQEYKSQLADKDYVHIHLGLNAYRSSALLNDNSGYVEAFFRTSLNNYKELFRSFIKALN